MAKAKKPKKKPKLTPAKRKAWKAFSTYIRTRDCLKTTGLPDYGKCITCGKTVPGILLQAGHFIAGRHSSNLFSEKGVNAQCYNCNINLKGNTLVYRRQLIKMYGEGIDTQLEEEDKVKKKYTLIDYKEIETKYKEKLGGKANK